MSSPRHRRVAPPWPEPSTSPLCTASACSRGWWRRWVGCPTRSPRTRRSRRAMREAYDELNVVQLSTTGLCRGNSASSSCGRRTASNTCPRPVPGIIKPCRSTLGGLFSRDRSCGGPCIVHDLDLSQDAVVGSSLGRCRSLVATPVVIPDLPMNWLVMLNERPDHFRIEHLEELILRLESRRGAASRAAGQPGAGVGEPADLTGDRADRADPADAAPCPLPRDPRADDGGVLRDVRPGRRRFVRLRADGGVTRGRRRTTGGRS